MRLALTLSAVLALLAAPAAAETVQGVWKPQSVKFTYIGVAQLYTCEGLRDATRNLVRHLGAKDVKVRIGPCFGTGDIGSLYNVTVDYSTLIEAKAGAEDSVRAEWQEVVIGRRSPRAIDDHHCELVERFSKYALPEMEHYEKVKGEAKCGASRADLVGKLHVRVLKPVDEGGD